MEDLKTNLFINTLYHFNEYQRLKKEFGKWDYLVDLQHAKFSVLYALIEESGLGMEYQEWKEKRVV